MTRRAFDQVMAETTRGAASHAAAPPAQRAVPILPVRCVPDALAHYQRLGFTTTAYAGDGEAYGFLRRDGIELHVTRHAALDPAENTAACYLYVEDADTLHVAWQAAEAEGRLIPPADTAYGLREFAHIDPDGNLLHVGSPLPEAGPASPR